MRRGYTALIVAGVLSAAFASTAAAAKLVADYQFNGSLAPSVGAAPALAPSGTGHGFASEATPNCQRQVGTFPADSGYSLDTTGVVPQDRYTVIVQFRSSLAGPYTRLLGFDADFLADDDGLYVQLFSGSRFLNLYNADDPVATERRGTTPISPEQYVEVAFTRTSAGLDSVYLNGALEVFYQESDADGLLNTNRLFFFRDNGAEDRPGAVSRIRVYDDALSAAEIKTTQGCIAPTACSGEAVTLAGTSRKNTLVGTSRADVIAGLGGNDKIRGLGGDDILCGGKGKDKLIGGAGKDRLVGSKGDDTCKGGKGKDKGKGCEAGKL
jgi:hypothetical protein